MNIDNAFVSRVIIENSIETLKKSGVESDMLFDKGKEALDFLQSFYSEHGKIPDKSTIIAKTGVTLYDDKEVGEPLSFYSKAVINRWISNMVKKDLSESMPTLETDPPQFLERMKSILIKTSRANRSITSGAADMRLDTNERWERYQKLKSLGGVIDGISTPWEILNQKTLGIHPGELWFIVAPIKTGKSWSKVLFFNHLRKQKKNVLLVTMEMPVDKFERRIDAVSAKLPYNHFQRGQLTLEQESMFAKSLKEYSEMETHVDILGNGIVKTVQDIGNFIDEKKPDVVLVDGAYFLTVHGTKSNSTWERVGEVAKGLQRLAQTKMVPIIGTTQFNRTIKKGKVNGDSTNIGFSYELAQCCDLLISLGRTPEQENCRQMMIRILENREGMTANILSNWDLDTMNFDEIREVSSQELDAMMGNTKDDSTVAF